MDAVHDWAGMGRPLQDRPLLVVCLQGGGEFENDVDAGDPAGIGFHYLEDGDFHVAEVYLEVTGFDTHGGSHTGPKGSRYQVRGGEAFPLSLVVDGGIGLYFCPGLEVGGNRSQFSCVNNC